MPYPQLPLVFILCLMLGLLSLGTLALIRPLDRFAQTHKQNVLSGKVKPTQIIRNVKVIKYTNTSSAIYLQGEDVFIELKREDPENFAVTECTETNNGTLYIFTHYGKNNYIYATDKNTADAIVALTECEVLDYHPIAT